MSWIPTIGDGDRRWWTVLVVLACCLSGPRHLAAGMLTAGDIAFVGWSSESPDGFALVTWQTLSPHTILYVTDRNWTGTGFAGREGTLRWDSGPDPLAAGTVLRFCAPRTCLPQTEFGSLLQRGRFDLSLSQDQAFVYQAASFDAGPDRFLTAFSNAGFGDRAASTLTGTGLRLGESAIAFPGGPDIGAYDGPRLSTDWSLLRGAVLDPGQWRLQNGAGNQAFDGLFPDLPFDDRPFQTQPSMVPEPPSVVLWALLAAAGWGWARRRRRRRGERGRAARQGGTAPVTICAVACRLCFDRHDRYIRLMRASAGFGDPGGPAEGLAGRTHTCQSDGRQRLSADITGTLSPARGPRPADSIVNPRTPETESPLADRDRSTRIASFRLSDLARTPRSRGTDCDTSQRRTTGFDCRGRPPGR